MCGIVGYSGKASAREIIINGLQRLEYRGYDSAGIAVTDGTKILVHKKQGRVKDLEVALPKIIPADSNTGIGHTRWATHGEPSNRNAHPHISPDASVAVVHNGIIENYAQLKKRLMAKGYEFKSETDTEVIAVLMEDIMSHTQQSPAEALRLALNEVVGAFAIVAIHASNPRQLLCARSGSPLVIGIGDEEYIVASDAAPIISITRNVLYLNDGEMAVLEPGSKPQVITITDSMKRNTYIEALETDLMAIEKNGYDHFMLKEIHEQPKTVMDSLRGRVMPHQSSVKLGGIEPVGARLSAANKLVIVGCGTSWHAGMVGKYLIEKLARLPVELDVASEYRYRDPILDADDILLAISQSGETADTLAAIELARERGALPLGICNVVGSSIARATDAGIYTHAGPEISVASTKAFTAQVSVLTAFALSVSASRRVLPVKLMHTLTRELLQLPGKMVAILEREDAIAAVAAELAGAHDVLFLGRGINYPVALEGALKLKEISYIHAEGYAAGEMKHGPIALVDENVPVIVIAPHGDVRDKTLSNLQEIRARKGRVIAIVTEGDEHLFTQAERIIPIPKTHEFLTPLLCTLPLQLLAYYAAIEKGCDVDMPRNLAKSVTVE